MTNEGNETVGIEESTRLLKEQLETHTLNQVLVDNAQAPEKPGVEAQDEPKTNDTAQTATQRAIENASLKLSLLESLEQVEREGTRSLTR